MSETNGYQSPFIDDGMEGEFTILAEPGLWSEVKVRYRPFNAAEESAVYAKSHLASGIGNVTFFAQLCATKILGWDLLDGKGEKVAPTAENLMKLNSLFFEILRDKMRQPVEQPKN